LQALPPHLKLASLADRRRAPRAGMVHDPGCSFGRTRLLDIPSPCVGICRLDPASGLCAGCMRTPAEIAAWPGASNAERVQIVLELRMRRRAVGRTSVADSRPRRRLSDKRR
jgi:predicted Fe-S protein YdhL (DUF1289 family)